MSINWNFGDQRAIETKSTFTKDADAAFDEFCKTYLNSSNGFFMSTPVSATSKSFSSESNINNIDAFISKLSSNRSLSNSNRTPQFEHTNQNQTSFKSAKNSISFRDSLSYFNNETQNELLKDDTLEPEENMITNDDKNKSTKTNIEITNHTIGKTSEDILINLRLKNSRNRTKRRSIENLMETFEEFNKANKMSHPPVIEESESRASIRCKPDIEIDKLAKTLSSTAHFKIDNKDKNTKEEMFKSKTIASNKGDTRPKSFYGYPNNFYIEKYLESSYKTIDIIDHLNDFNKNYDRNKSSGKIVGESDFSAINDYAELTLNENTTPDDDKSKMLNNSKLLNQLNNLEQLQQEKIHLINNVNNRTELDIENHRLNSINNKNLLENEVKKDVNSYSNLLSDKILVLSNQQANSDKDYNRASFHEAAATQEIVNETPRYSFTIANDFKSSVDDALFHDNRFQKPSSLLETNYDQLVLDIPKKKSFSEEFFKPKTTQNQIGQAVNRTTYITNSNNTTISNVMKENDTMVNDYISSYIAIPPTLTFEKPTGWLGFKVIACGMRKNGQLPIPKPNYFIDKGDFGDDAGFYSENVYGDAIGIADGATGNCMLGYDPGDFSRNLMQLCSEIFVRENKMHDAKTLLLKAYDAVQDKTCYGSCTACVLSLSHSNSIMTAANVGDTGYCVIRNNVIVHKSIPQRISYECPKQLDSYPWKEKSRKMGVSYTEILGNDTTLEHFKVQKDDIVIVSSDGLYDNLEFDEIEAIYQKSKNDYDAVRNLVFNSVKFYRKPDDILVIIAKVVDNKPASIQQKFTRDPYIAM